MKTTFYFNGKRITKKAATELLGKEKLDRFIEEAHRKRVDGQRRKVLH